MSVLVFGHKSPDTDSVVSAIALARLIGGEARVQGEISKETGFVLQKFGLAVPVLLGKVAGEKVAIVDTTDPMQLPEDIAEAEVVRVVDHHMLGGLKTAGPVDADVRTWGCTATVIWSLFEKEISAEVAGAMMCAILSDTVLFKSPTTTEYDRRAVEALAEIAGIEDYEGLGMEMLRIKSSIEDDSAMDLIKRDFKDFDFGGKKVGIGQVELVELQMFDGKKAGVVAEMKRVGEEGGFWGVVMLITDVMKKGSLVLVDSEDDGRVGESLGGDLKAGEGWIDGIMSRKKQVAAPLAEKL